MKSEYINPFIEATVETYETMCGVVPKRNGELSLQTGIFDTHDLIGMIGLSGNVCGAVLMTSTVDTAKQVVGAFLGEEIKEADGDLLDGFGEILNIIAGAAAAKLNGLNIKLAIPTVILGTNQKLAGQERSPWINIPMCFPEWGKFNVEVSMEERK